MCDFTLEDEHQTPVFGFDEVGRGPLCGPVVAACVYIPESTRNLKFIENIRDSKTISKKQLKILASDIKNNFIYGIGNCSPKEIDQVNILKASLLAMKKAFSSIPKAYAENCIALIDGKFIPENLECKAYPIIKGDQKSKSIAAASILAKVERDNIMKNLSTKYPQYGWDHNAGYPTKEHREAIIKHGITPEHRKSFAPIRNHLLNKSA